ncbi:MAG: cupin domain-containing protein, partial [Alphaproteobacteria bacterium]|nr:cupin domain-containing protein [Alphaproteobacteria bacterium]
AWSSQRHWHIAQDEFIYIVSGELTLVTDAGAETLRAGDCAGFKAGDSNGHHLQNRSAADATFLEMGTRLAEDGAHYPDIDMIVPPHSPAGTYTHRDGTPYPKQERRGA